jgi:allantoinase
MKERGRADIFAAWGGVAGAQSLLAAIFTEATWRAAGELDAARLAGFVAWRLAAKPAQRFGLWPRKGRIARGADADIVLFDPAREWTLTAEDSQTGGVSPYVGRSFTGAVIRTLVRGRTVYADGVVTDRPAGRFIPRVKDVIGS